MPSPTITLFLPSLEGGGAERVFVQLANAFVALGIRVDFALVSARGPYLEELSPDVRIIDFDSSGVLRCLPKLVRYLRSNRPSVLLSGLDHANVIAVLASVASRSKVRCVISSRAATTALYQGDRTVSTWIMLRLMRLAYRSADEVIAVSRFVAQDLSQFLRIPEDKVKIVYNPLDLDRIEQRCQATMDHRWCGAGNPPIILGVGSLVRVKDFPTLIRAFSIVRSKRNCRLVILGEGADRAKLELLISQLGLQQDIYLPGFVSNPFAWMRHAEVFVSTSLTEGCPNALMQALACDTPVISTDGPGGSAEVLEGGRWGRLVPVGDSRALAEAILTTLDTTSRSHVRQRAEDFALGTIARQYLQILLPDYAPSVLGS